MRINKKEIIETEIPDRLQCDVCQDWYFYKDPYDMFRIEEFTRINFIGGFSSVFGDGNKIELDICDICLSKLLGNHIYINGKLNQNEQNQGIPIK